MPARSVGRQGRTAAPRPRARSALRRWAASSRRPVMCDLVATARCAGHQPVAPPRGSRGAARPGSSRERRHEPSTCASPPSPLGPRTTLDARCGPVLTPRTPQASSPQCLAPRTWLFDYSDVSLDGSSSGQEHPVGFSPRLRDSGARTAHGFGDESPAPTESDAPTQRLVRLLLGGRCWEWWGRGQGCGSRGVRRGRAGGER